MLGVVKAHVYAEGKLTLGATARIDGNVIAGMIEVDPGAYYTGHLSTYDSRTPFYNEAEPTDAAIALPASRSPVDALPSDRSGMRVY